MMSMLEIMKDTDDHFETVADQLKKLHDRIPTKLVLVKSVDSPAE